VLANGGVIAPAGVHMVALAAKRHSVPLVVLVGLHKLSPLFPHDPDVTFNGVYVCIFDTRHTACINACKYRPSGR
jgi:translation initiation factor 2B subunit (eIF-2B alpha/beta/delta family)